MECRGPRYLPNEFRVLRNGSVNIFPHDKIYDNGSYILTHDGLVLCSNFTRNFTVSVVKTVEQNVNGEPHQSLTLRIITYVGFALSIVFLLFLLVTYFLFAELRTNFGKMVMHLSCAMIAMQSVYFACDPDVVSSAVCAVMGALLHFTILAVFFWMSAIAHNTQKTFANPGKYFFLQSTPFVLLSYLMSCHVMSSIISSHLIRYLISSHSLSHLISTHLISSRLVSSHLVASYLISSHRISSHLISSHLISSLGEGVGLGLRGNVKIKCFVFRLQ